MLAVSGGRMICLSTPYGKRGFFYDAWAKGGADWHRIEIPADKVSRISPEFLARERRALGESWYRQEYCCSFEALEGRAAPAIIAWDGGPTGNGTDWLDPVNWAGDVLPGAGDDVFIGSTGSNPTIKIYTTDGALVKTIANGFTWDGRNESGRLVASGTYVFLVTTGAGSTRGRVAVIR